MAFLHEKPDEIPAGKSEGDPVGREKLQAFRALCEKRVCKYWCSAADLGGKVSRSVVNLINTQPGVGWVRGDQVPDEGQAETINRLRDQAETLQQELDRLRREPPKGAEDLAQGREKIVVHFSYQHPDALMNMDGRPKKQVAMSWDEIFAALGPCMIREASEFALQEALRDAVLRKTGIDVRAKFDLETESGDFHKIVVQLRALGLISPSQEKRSVKDRGATYWSLTPYGDDYMNRLVAIRRRDSEGSGEKEASTSG